MTEAATRGGLRAAAAVTLSKGNVKSRHLAANAVTSAKVKDGSLRARDFRSGQLPRGAEGPAGPAGAQGAPGASGASGTDGVSGLEVVSQQGNTIFGVSAVTSSATAKCPAGKHVIAGGAELRKIFSTANPTLTTLGESYPRTTGAPQGWFASMESNYGEDWAVVVHAVCANAQ